ncbi:MAG: DJ-1/PfpI family protein [Candidatus Omnitrophica bacterium]|nr:DJ-1/PfpI family protein [Candidatus Omnitrophota bacterium]
MRNIGKCVLAALFVISFFSLQATAQTGKKAVMLIAQDGFQDDELFRPKEVLEKNGIAVTVASSSLTEAKGMNGGKFMPQVLLGDVQTGDFDAVVFIGGSGAAPSLDNPQAHKLPRDAAAQGKIVGAICIAPRILANAGVLKGRRATVYPTEGGKLKDAGVNYTAMPVEIDGEIITADGPDSAVRFGEEIVKALKDQ